MSFLNSLFGKRTEDTRNIVLLPSSEFLVAVIGKKEQLIDVRTPREFDNENIKGAINIDWFQPFRFKKAIQNLDKERAVYDYCRTGNRSHKAALELASMGFVQIYDLQGGITAVK